MHTHTPHIHAHIHTNYLEAHTKTYTYMCITGYPHSTRTLPHTHTPTNSTFHAYTHTHHALHHTHTHTHTHKHTHKLLRGTHKDIHIHVHNWPPHSTYTPTHMHTCTHHQHIPCTHTCTYKPCILPHTHTHTNTHRHKFGSTHKHIHTMCTTIPHIHVCIIMKRGWTPVCYTCLCGPRSELHMVPTHANQLKSQLWVMGVHVRGAVLRWEMVCIIMKMAWTPGGIAWACSGHQEVFMAARVAR